MDTSSIWLIDHKASLSEGSPMNMDGSTWLTGICVLAAKDREAAMTRFSEYLSERGMGLLELFSLSEYVPGNYNDATSQSEQINNAVRLIHQDDGPCYVCAKTSEYYDALSEDEDDA